MTIRGVVSTDAGRTGPERAPSDREIVVGVDRSSSARAAIAVAARLAAEADARLCLVHVIGPGPGGAPVDVEDEASVSEPFDLARRLLADEWSSRGRVAPPPPVIEAVRLGSPAREIVACAGDRGAGLIVTGTSDEAGRRRLASGSVAGEIVRGTSLPVLIVPEGSPPLARGGVAFARPLVLVDLAAGERASREAVRVASRVASGERLDVVSISGGEAGASPARASTARLEGWAREALAGLPGRILVRDAGGDAGLTPLEHALGGPYDLVVCPDDGRARGPLRDANEAIVDAARRPVLVVKAPLPAGGALTV